MKSIKIILFCCCISLLTKSEIVAQTAENFAIYQQAILNTITVYHENIGDQSALLNGKKYNDMNVSFEENAHLFFEKEGFQSGSIVYENVPYPNIKLFYDEVENAVVIQDGIRKIKLHNSRIKSFKIGKNHFSYYEEDDSKLPSAFYQILYSGTSKVLKREVKSIREDISSISRGTKYFIKDKQFYYIELSGSIYSAQKSKDVLKIYEIHKNEIQKYIKDNDLVFRKNKDEFLVLVATYYEQLKH